MPFKGFYGYEAGWGLHRQKEKSDLLIQPKGWC